MPNRMLLLIAAAQLLGMTLWFSATAAAPAIATELSISSSVMAWLTMAVQAGFVVGTLISATLNLADVLNARRLFALGCVAGAIANASIALAETPATIIALRFGTGLALACVYPPGLKIAAGWFLDRRGAALGVVVGALTLGSAFPHLLAWLAARRSLARVDGRLVAPGARGCGNRGPVGQGRTLRQRLGAIRSPRRRARVTKSRRPACDARLSGPHVGALRHVDLDSGVRRRVNRRVGRHRHASGLARRVRHDCERRRRLRHRRPARGRLGEGTDRGRGHGRQRRLLARQPAWCSRHRWPCSSPLLSSGVFQSLRTRRSSRRWSPNTVHARMSGLR